MASTLEPTRSRPWYREPWPWFLISLPAAAVIAGLITVWIAYRSADGLVVGDYYKAGLAINQTLARDERARDLGLNAAIMISGPAIELDLAGRLDSFPPSLKLSRRPGTAQRRQMAAADRGSASQLAPEWRAAYADDRNGDAALRRCGGMSHAAHTFS